MKELPRKWQDITSLSEWSKATKSIHPRCELTNTDMDLHSHHVYDKSTYPDRSFDLDNVLVMAGYLHNDSFHKRFKGGSNKPTTPQDLIAWIKSLKDKEVSPERKAKVMKKLNNLIRKYETSHVNNKHYKAKHDDDDIFNELKKMQQHKPRRTENGNHIHTKGKSRHSAKTIDKVHQDKRNAIKNLNLAQKAHKKELQRLSFKYVALIAIVITFALIYTVNAMYKDYKLGSKYGYDYITLDSGERKWFDKNSGSQLDKAPDFKNMTVKPIGGFNEGDFWNGWFDDF